MARECKAIEADWQSGGNSLEDLVSLLKNRLTFVFHDIGDEALVYTVFEVLNSRGLAVSWFDRLKSMLMAIVFESDTGKLHKENAYQVRESCWKMKVLLSFA